MLWFLLLSLWINSKILSIRMLLRNTFLWCKVVLTFDSVDKMSKCDHSKDSDRAIPSCGVVYYAVGAIMICRFKF